MLSIGGLGAMDEKDCKVKCQRSGCRAGLSGSDLFPRHMRLRKTPSVHFLQCTCQVCHRSYVHINSHTDPVALWPLSSRSAVSASTAPSDLIASRRPPYTSSSSSSFSSSILPPLALTAPLPPSLIPTTATQKVYTSINIMLRACRSCVMEEALPLG